MVSFKFFLEKRKRSIQDFILEYAIKNVEHLNQQLIKMQLNYDLSINQNDLFDIVEEKLKEDVSLEKETEEEIPKSKKKRNQAN